MARTILSFEHYFVLKNRPRKINTTIVILSRNGSYLGPRRGPLDEFPVLDFLFAGSFLTFSSLRLLFVGVEGRTLKKLSSRPCVEVVRFF